MRRAAALCLVVGLPALYGQLSVDDPWPMHGQNVRLTGQSTATADTAGASTGKAGELNWRVQMQDCDDRRRALGSDSRNSSSSDDDDGCGSNMALVSSSVAVSSDGTMFIGTYDGHMHAISTSDGTYSWKEKFTDCSFQYSAVSIDQDGLLVVGCSAGLLAVHQSSGKKAWFYALDDAVTASPTIDPEGGVIYAPCTDGNVYAFHKTGALKWSSSLGSAAGRSGALSEERGELYVADEGGELHALSTKDGSKLWRYDGGAAMKSAVAITGTGDLVGAAGVTLFKLNATGAPQWTHALGAHTQNDPTLPGGGADGVVLIGDESATFYAIHLQNGTRLWAQPTVAAVTTSKAAIGTDGSTAYVGDASGRVYAFTVATGEALWQYETAGDEVAASPAIGADGALVVGDAAGYLYALGTGATTNPGQGSGQPSQIVQTDSPGGGDAATSTRAAAAIAVARSATPPAATTTTLGAAAARARESAEADELEASTADEQWLPMPRSVSAGSFAAVSAAAALVAFGHAARRTRMTLPPTHKYQPV